MVRGVRARGFALLLVFLASVAYGSGPASAQTRLSQTRRKLQAARARLLQVRRSDAELIAVIGRLGGQLNSTRNALAAAENDLTRITAMIGGEERRLARLDAERLRRASVVAKRARSLYIMGPGMGAEALLGSKTIDEFIDRQSSLNYAMRFDQTLMDDLARIADASRKTRVALAERRTAAARVRGDIAERASTIAEIIQTKQVAEIQLSNQADVFQQEVASLEAEQARILSLIRSRQSRSTGRISRRGFIWPVRGEITSPYGPRWGGFHTGIDINCETGDRIVAAKGGKVIAAEWGGGYGKMVIIDHGNGVSTLYAHNSALYVHDGQSVGRGQRISACGATGHAYGDHLHFEVRINGEHTNPRPFLP